MTVEELMEILKNVTDKSEKVKVYNYETECYNEATDIIKLWDGKGNFYGIS